MPMQRRRFIHLGMAACAATMLAACGKKNHTTLVPTDATVLALGDSLTEGYGATLQTSYPSVLAQMTGWSVINAGISGDTSAGALARLPSLLEQHRPQLVLTSIGGNDFLRRMDRTATRSNIIAICEQIKAGGSQNMLIAVPEVSVMAAAIGSLSDDPMYQEIASKLGLPLQRGGWAQVLSDAALRSDQVHANAQGYARFAELLARSLRDAGLLRG